MSIHGTPSSSFIWRNIPPSLVEAGYQAHVYDLLGYGLSERPWSSDIDTSVTGQVPILEGLMAHWALGDAHIVSHDIGGAFAQRLSVFSPKRVRSLTLIDVCSFDSWPSKRTHQQFQEWLLSTVIDKQGLTESALDTYLDFISGPIGQGSLFHHQVSHCDPRRTAELTDRLAELGALPVQIIWGWQVVDWTHKLHDAIPNSELHVLKNCGHFAMEDKPAEINRHLIDFLTAHARG